MGINDNYYDDEDSSEESSEDVDQPGCYGDPDQYDPYDKKNCGKCAVADGCETKVALAKYEADITPIATSTRYRSRTRNTTRANYAGRPRRNSSPVRTASRGYVPTKYGNTSRTSRKTEEVYEIDAGEDATFKGTLSFNVLLESMQAGFSEIVRGLRNIPRRKY